MRTKATNKKHARKRLGKPIIPVERRINPPRDAKRARTTSRTPEKYAATTEERAVVGPVMSLVHSGLGRAFRVNKRLPMCFIFDRVSPARLFKRRTPYNEHGPFAQWTAEELAEATDTDELDEETGIAKLMPFEPKPYTQRYFFHCTTDLKTFLQWGEGEMRTVRWQITKGSRVVGRSIDIPAAYHRLVCQLTAEIAHASSYFGHEALRRCSYAMEVLDAFGTELTSSRSLTADFRSKILTPILQRQLRGASDCYFPPMSYIVSSDGATVTIGDATRYYLAEDPTHPKWIPSYRRNLIYIPEMRWHLGVVMGKVKLGDTQGYNNIRANHDHLMKALKAEETEPNAWISQSFNAAEITAIVKEGLEEYFSQELADSQDELRVALEMRAASAQK